MSESKFIGVVRDAETKEIFSVINPDDDSELDSPRWALLQDKPTRAMQLIKVPRSDYMATTTLGELMSLLAKLP